jgi:Arc/MetJ-type ribon-helix-helix transcriptional regulator
MIVYHEIMIKSHGKRPSGASEPIQVYLDRSQRRRLERLAGELGLSKSDVVRRGLEALERQMSDPAEHPALAIIGIAPRQASSGPAYDVAREHDRFLAESEQRSWKGAGSQGRRKRGG